jgi:uncharacterized integral membrane protein
VRWLKTLLWMIVFIIAILFSMQNKGEVTLRFGLYPFQQNEWLVIPSVPLFLPILCAIFLGILVGGISDLYRRLQLKRALRQSQRTVERLEGEIQSSYRPGIGDSFSEPFPPKEPKE